MSFDVRCKIEPTVKTVFAKAIIKKLYVKFFFSIVNNFITKIIFIIFCFLSYSLLNLNSATKITKQPTVTA